MTMSNENRNTPKKFLLAIILILLLAIVPFALWRLPSDPHKNVPKAAENRTQLAFDTAKGLGEPGLYTFLRNMPKGGDLHLHLTGAVYAENFIRQAAADNLCVNASTLTLGPGHGAGKAMTCGTGEFPATKALANEDSWDAMINAFSLREFVPHNGVDAHDQFFSTFSRFLAVTATTHGGQWLDEVATRAALQNEQYVEVMHLPATGAILGLASKIHWKGDSDAQLADLKKDAEAAGLAAVVAQAKDEFDAMERSRNAIEHCGTPQATPACGVTLRWIFGVLRDFSPEQLFAQTLVGYEVTKLDPNVVAINYLRAEDWRGSLDEYHTGMRIVQWMRPQYPNAHLSLHAGELTLGIVTPEDLRDHIRQAVEVAGAERIGHGVDIGYETDSIGLLREMAQKNIMVEINLTSNDALLGVKGSQHALAMYMAAHVPVALSTDDEGVSRIDITHEYVKAVEEQGLDYAELKRMARTSMEHAFLPGASLWATPTDATGNVQIFNNRQTACADPITANSFPPGPCHDFLKNSERATQQYELERRFAAFEASAQ
jgi:adenosine deaminase